MMRRRGKKGGYGMWVDSGIGSTQQEWTERLNDWTISRGVAR